jgi:hypothetical protein
MKTFFVHAGGAKTGSSAIQNFLELNHPVLAESGVAYLNRVNINSEDEITSGNGLYLFDLLIRRSADHLIDSAVLSYFGEHDSAICSSEFFSHLSADNWTKLLQSTVRVGVQLRVIFYVRNVVPFILSSYDQAIKRHGEFRDFSEWVNLADWPNFSSLKAIDDALLKSSLTVLSYDKEKSSLLDSFLKAINLDGQVNVSPENRSRIVNRSLTKAERDVIKTVNAYLGADFGESLSNMLIKEKPNASVTVGEIDGRLEAFLNDQFQERVTWVNAKYFSGKPVVSVSDVDLGGGVSAGGDQERPEPRCLEGFVLNWLLETAKGIKEHTVRNLLSMLTRAAQKEFSYLYSNVPIDFDPLAYLDINPDVALAGVDPIKHYCEHGIREGRRYKFLGTVEEQDPHRESLELLYRQIAELTALVEQWRIYSDEIGRSSAARERMLALKNARANSDTFPGPNVELRTF